MGKYAKTAYGERLTYRPSDLDRYEGQQFCLRITPEDVDLDRCFFVYLDERIEEGSLRKLFEAYFVHPGMVERSEMAGWLGEWLYLDPMLNKKYMMLRQMFEKVQEGAGLVAYHINHGPSGVNLDDSVRSHLGTSVFSDGSFDDKILDVVLEFRVDGRELPEVEQWRRIAKTDTTKAKGAVELANRRSVLGWVIFMLAALVSFPFLWIGCRNNGRGHGGFGGGML